MLHPVRTVSCCVLVVLCACGQDDAPGQPPQQDTTPAKTPPVAQPGNPGTPAQGAGQPNNQQGGSAQQADSQQAGTNESPNTPSLQIPGFGTVQIPVPLGNTDGNPGSGTQAERPAKIPPSAPHPSALTPSGSLTPAFMSSQTQAIHASLVAVLPQAQKSRIASIPLTIINDSREPNAGAGCTKSTRRPFMMITSSMLMLIAGISETRAYDEVAGTQTYEQYAQAAVDQMRGRRAITGVAPGILTAPTATDQRKVARQLQLFEQQVAFILAHELAHHYRGHTSCSGQGASLDETQIEELGRMASDAFPLFSQPFEVEADTWAVTNVLEAGSSRTSGSWDEEGGVVNLQFFGRLRTLGGDQVLRVFLSTHPMPQVRMPIVRMAASQWAPGRWPPTGPASLGVPGANDSGGGGTGGTLQLPTGSLPIPDLNQILGGGGQ